MEDATSERSTRRVGVPPPDPGEPAQSASSPSSLSPTDPAAAFQALYPQLRRFAAVVAPVGTDPDDLVQDALARTLAHGSLDRLDNPAAYLYQAIRNGSASLLRKRERGQRAIRRLGGGGDLYPGPDASDISLLHALPPDQRGIVFLVHVEGFSMAEAAEAMGCTPVAARARASRGIRRLRQLLKDADS